MSDYVNTPRVDHPIHYGGVDDPYETIKILQDKMTPQAFAGYLEGCARKYLDRHLKKEGLVDVEKALWFVTRLRDFLRDSGYDKVYERPRWERLMSSDKIATFVHETLQRQDSDKCEQAKAADLALLVTALADKGKKGKKYVDFYRSVAMHAGVPRAEAQRVCAELGYDMRGKKKKVRAA